MSELTRRTMLSGAAAAAAIAPLGAPWAAFAAAPPAGTQVPGWYRYKVGTFRDHGGHRRCQPLQAAGRSRPQRQEGGRQRRAARAPHGAGRFHRSVQSDRRQHRPKPCAHRYRHGRGGVPVDQGIERPVDDQSGRRRHRPQGDRYRHHLALPRRSCERPAQGRQFAGLPECRNSGAGGRAQVLDGRRRDEPRAQGPHGRSVQEQSPGVLRRRDEAACAPTTKARRSSRASLR